LIKHKEILEKLRDFMKRENLDFFIVSATDEYLNEYISLNENSRYVITGFSGSTGVAFVTMNDVFLFVDGRYHLQADNETDKNLVTVVKVGMDTSIFQALMEKILNLANKNQNIGFVSRKVSFASFKKLVDEFNIKKVNYIKYDYDPVLEIAGIIPQKATGYLRYVPTSIAGIDQQEKLNIIRSKLDELEIDVLAITKLEEIAYLFNLRGQQIPYSSSFKAISVVNSNKALLFTDLSTILAEIRNNYNNNFEFREKEDFLNYLKEIENKGLNIGFAPGNCNLFTYLHIENKGNNVVQLEQSPISQMMAVKNPAEIAHMENCFRSTDIVVNRAICWLNQNLEKGVNVTEKDFSEKVKSLFLEEGAYGLSFEVIAASGKNTAVIHYTNPDPNRNITMGELVLLDCGAYFEGGYATDITRTFLAGGLRAKASAEAREIYTKVLKAFLQGITYKLQDDTTGFDIDKKVRKNLMEDTQEAFKFAHGTGHGVGIAVHESPPRISPSDTAKTELKPGMCFTIEPGLYNNKWGGVRLENTVTVISTASGNEIKSLVRAGFDESLIDWDKLSEQEAAWLKNYQKKAIG
jgi:Xaa-Pro aminopeptidase